MEASGLSHALDDSVRRMEEAAHATSINLYYSENLRFHWLMVEALGNAVLAKTYRNIVQRLHQSRLTNLAHGLNMLASLSEHREIGAAGQAGGAASSC